MTSPGREEAKRTRLPGFDALYKFEGFEYLASPYTDPDPLIREMRYIRTAEVVTVLLRCGIWVYSPIVHCHHLSQVWGLPHDAAFWAAYDRAMIVASKGICVLRLEGWAKSAGVKGEIQLAIELGKRITYMSGDLNAEAAVDIYPDSPKPPAAGV